MVWQRRRPVQLRPSERLEGDDGSRVGYASNTLDLFRNEVADIGRRLDIEFDQQIEVAGRRIDLGSYLGIGELTRHLVGFTELTFDLHEEWDHAPLRSDA